MPKRHVVPPPGYFLAQIGDQKVLKANQAYRLRISRNVQRVVRLELSEQAIRLGLRLLERHPRAKPAHHGVVPAPVSRIDTQS